MTSSSAKDTSKAVDNNVTFTKDVAPIFYKNCTACHRPGEVAPMSLLTYKDARPWAKAALEPLASRPSPRGAARDGRRHRHRERRLRRLRADV